MKKVTSLVLTALIFLSFSTNCFSQLIGKIHPKEEANILFGNVVQTVEMKAAELSKLIEGANRFVMFRFVGEQVIIAGDGRNILSNSGIKVENNDIFHVWSKQRVVEIINKDVTGIVKIEKRPETITLTNGVSTLEEGQPCPPICWLNETITSANK